MGAADLLDWTANLFRRPMGRAVINICVLLVLAALFLLGGLSISIGGGLCLWGFSLCTCLKAVTHILLVCPPSAVSLVTLGGVVTAGFAGDETRAGGFLRVCSYVCCLG